MDEDGGFASLELPVGRYLARCGATHLNTNRASQAYTEHAIHHNKQATRAVPTITHIMQVNLSKHLIIEDPSRNSTHCRLLFQGKIKMEFQSYVEANGYTPCG